MFIISKENLGPHLHVLKVDVLHLKRKQTKKDSLSEDYQHIRNLTFLRL